MEKFQIRKAITEDKSGILALYKGVSTVEGGLARIASEISMEYVDHFSGMASKNGVQYIVADMEKGGEIIAEIHCYQLVPTVFRHVLSELTIAVNKDYQGIGLGKKLFQAMLNHITLDRPDILRVELIARESNIKALKMYETLGFIVEGRFEKRIRSSNGEFEADIPMAWFNESFNWIKNEF